MAEPYLRSAGHCGSGLFPNQAIRVLIGVIVRRFKARTVPFYFFFFFSSTICDSTGILPCQTLIAWVILPCA